MCMAIEIVDLPSKIVIFSGFTHWTWLFIVDLPFFAQKNQQPNSPGCALLVEKASIEMFDEPMDYELWQLVALSAGTGNARQRQLDAREVQRSRQWKSNVN